MRSVRLSVARFLRFDLMDGIVALVIVEFFQWSKYVFYALLTSVNNLFCICIKDCTLSLSMSIHHRILCG